MSALQKKLEITKYYGINNTTAAVNLQYEAVSIKNFLLKNLGKLTTRPGSTLVGNDTGAYKQLGLTHYVSGSTKVQIKVENTVIQKLASATWSNMSGGTGLTADKEMNFCFANGYLYGFNATDDVRKIDATTVTTVPAIPKGAWAIWWRNIMFVGGVLAYPNRIYTSVIGDPETFNANDWFDVEPGDGDVLTGGIGLKDKVMFSKSGAWYYLVGSGTNTFAIYPITYEFGSVNYRSIVSFGNDAWCVDVNGRVQSVIRNQYGLFNGADMSSEFLEDTTATINKAGLASACAYSFETYLMFAVPTGSSTVNDLVLVYNFNAPVPNGKSKWTTITGWTPSVFDDMNNILYFGEGNADGKVYSWTGNTDNGTAIACEWISPKYKFDNEGQKKRFMTSKWFAYPLGNYNVTIYSSIDEGVFQQLGLLNLTTNSPLWGTPAVWGTGVWGVTGEVHDLFHYSDAGRIIGTKLQHKIIYLSSNGEAEIGSHIMYYQDKNWRPL